MGTNLDILLPHQLTFEQGYQLVDIFNQHERFPALVHLGHKYHLTGEWAILSDRFTEWANGDVPCVADGCGFNIYLSPHIAIIGTLFRWWRQFMINLELRQDIRFATFEIAKILHPQAPKAIYQTDDQSGSLFHLFEEYVDFEEYQQHLIKKLKIPPSPLDMVYPDYEAMSQAEYELSEKYNVERYEFYYIDTFDDLRHSAPK